jgi:hypothetical protein
VEPAREQVVPLVGGGVGGSIGPFAEGGLDEALGLAVGSGTVGLGGGVAESEALAGGTEGPRDVTGTIVGEDPTDAYPHASIVADRLVEEAYRRAMALVGMHSGEGNPRVVIDAHMHEVVADPIGVLATVARHPMTWLSKARQLLDVQME